MSADLCVGVSPASMTYLSKSVTGNTIGRWVGAPTSIRPYRSLDYEAEPPNKPPAADTLQPPLRFSFRVRLRRSVGHLERDR